MPRANARHLWRDSFSASKQAVRRLVLRAATGASPITSRGAAAGKAATGKPLASASSSTRAEGVCAAGEHEDVGGSIDASEPLALPLAEEHRLRVAAHQRLTRGAGADYDLCSRQIEREKSLDANKEAIEQKKEKEGS